MVAGPLESAEAAAGQSVPTAGVATAGMCHDANADASSAKAAPLYSHAPSASSAPLPLEHHLTAGHNREDQTAIAAEPVYRTAVTEPGADAVPADSAVADLAEVPHDTASVHEVPDVTASVIGVTTVEPPARQLSALLQMGSEPVPDEGAVGARSPLPHLGKRSLQDAKLQVCHLPHAFSNSYNQEQCFLTCLLLMFQTEAISAPVAAFRHLRVGLVTELRPVLKALSTELVV